MLQHDGAEAVNMVRMEMGQEQGFGLAHGNAHIAQVAGCAFTGVDDENPVPGDDYRAGSGTARIREGGAGSAQGQMQTVRQTGHDVAPHLRVRNPLQKPSADFALKYPRKSSQQHAQGDQAQQYPFHQPHACLLVIGQQELLHALVYGSVFFSTPVGNG